MKYLINLYNIEFDHLSQIHDLFKDNYHVISHHMKSDHRFIESIIVSSLRDISDIRDIIEILTSEEGTKIFVADITNISTAWSFRDSRENDMVYDFIKHR